MVTADRNTPRVDQPGQYMRHRGAWLARALILALLLTSLRPAPPRALPGPTQVVTTSQPLLCMHTRLNDEVEAWKIQRSLQLVREMGADTIVEFFPWAYIENTEGVYGWDHADTIVSHALNQGLQIIARLGLVPEWARPQPESPGSAAPYTTLNYLQEARFPDFARFAAAFAERYRGQVSQIIIWNEPNLAFEWGYRPVSPAGYTELLRQAYEAAKAVNPDIQVMAAPMAPTLEPEGSPWGMHDLLYIERMYEAGAGAYFDAMAVHTYGFTLPPDAPPGREELNFRRVELIYDIMQKNGDGAKPIYITESGWNDHPRWTKAVSPGERIRYTIDSYRWTAQSLPAVQKLCQWVLRYPAPTSSYPDNFTYLTPDFRPRLIYDYMKSFALGEEITLP